MKTRKKAVNSTAPENLLETAVPAVTASRPSEAPDSSVVLMVKPDHSSMVRHQGGVHFSKKAVQGIVRVLDKLEAALPRTKPRRRSYVSFSDDVAIFRTFADPVGGQDRQIQLPVGVDQTQEIAKEAAAIQNSIVTVTTALQEPSSDPRPELPPNVDSEAIGKIVRELSQNGMAVVVTDSQDGQLVSLPPLSINQLPTVPIVADNSAAQLRGNVSGIFAENKYILGNRIFHSDQPFEIGDGVEITGEVTGKTIAMTSLVGNYVIAKIQYSLPSM